MEKRIGGWGGIRTHETLSRLPVFKTGSFNHSDTHPCAVIQRLAFLQTMGNLQVVLACRDRAFRYEARGGVTDGVADLASYGGLCHKIQTVYQR